MSRAHTRVSSRWDRGTARPSLAGTSPFPSRPPRWLVAAAALLFLPASLSAQYFGRNKVRYHDFDFRVLETAHFDIHFYPEEKEAVGDATRMSERWYERLARTFGHEFQDRKPLILYADHPDFQQTNVLEGEIDESTGGVTESIKERVTVGGGETASDSTFAALQARGRRAMGVDQYTSTHVFDALPHGGRIELQRDVDDPAGVAQIRQHLQEIARAFKAGEFDTPAFVHRQPVPGTSVLGAKRDAITYRAIRRTVTELPDGVRTVTESDDPRVAAYIKEHVASMERRLAEGDLFNVASPTLPRIFENADRIQTEVEQTPTGVVFTQTSEDPEVVALLQAHAREVSDLAREGMAALMRSIMENGGRMGRGGRHGMGGMMMGGGPMMEQMHRMMHGGTAEGMHGGEVMPEGSTR